MTAGVKPPFWAAVVALALALVAVAGISRALAHETPIAVLELKESQPGQFIASWIFTSSRNIGPPSAVFPDHCVFEKPRLDCGERGLVGTLTVDELGERYSGAVIRLTRRNGARQSFTLTGGNPSVTFVANPGEDLGAKARIAAAYVDIGIEHILLGVDHLLFVFGLIWLVRSRWMLVKTITAFTVAHSITLAAATFGWVGVPERAVNAAIALSIVFVGAEIVRLHRGHDGLSSRHPWVVAFAFGLLHGFGFANALTNLGLPPADLPLALLSFNVGVEIGQIAFVVLVLTMQWSYRVLDVILPRWSRNAPAYAIGSVAMFWFVNRLTVIIGT